MGWYQAWKSTEAIVNARGVVRPRDLVRRGVPPSWLYHFAGLDLTRLGPGLYGHCNQPRDPFLLVGRKYLGLTVGALSALWFHRLIDRPEHNWFIIGIKDRKPPPHDPQARFLRSSWPREDLHDWRDDRVFPAHTVVRAVLDCIRFRKKLGEQRVDDALDAVFAKTHLDPTELEARARQLHVLAPLKRWLLRQRSRSPIP